MKLEFIGRYGCFLSDEAIALKTDSKENAKNYIHQCAIECYKSFEGIYITILDKEGISERYNLYDELEINKLYEEEIENNIYYNLEPFDYENEKHLAVLKEQENKFWEI